MLEAACSPKRYPPRKTRFQTGRAAEAGREPAPPAPPAAKNNHGRVTFSGEVICMALRAGCCVPKCCCFQGSECSSLGMKVARIRGYFCWGKRTGSVFQFVWTHSRQWNKHSFLGQLAPRRAPTCQPLTITGRGWIHPHDPVHAVNSPHAFISLSVTVTHALHLPVYRLFSQGPCGGNDWLGGTGLLAQILEGKPPEVWEQEREEAGVGRLHTGTSLAGTETTVYPTAWLHPRTGYTQEPKARPGLAPPALPGIALAARCLRGRGGCHPQDSSSKRSSAPSLEMAPTLPPFISHPWGSGMPNSLGTRMRGKLSTESQRNGGLMTREGQEDGGSSQGLAGHLEIAPKEGSQCEHPLCASHLCFPGDTEAQGRGSVEEGGCALWFHGASVPFESP